MEEKGRSRETLENHRLTQVDEREIIQQLIAKIDEAIEISTDLNQYSEDKREFLKKYGHI